MEPTLTDEFRRWLDGCRAGDRYIYHRGMIAKDRHREFCSDGVNADAVDHLAWAVLRAEKAGLVTLVQKRHGDLDYEYIAVRAGARS